MLNAHGKHIIICADDFGMNHAIDAGILQLAALGRLDATSCLVQGPTFSRGCEALKASNLQLGVHLNFTEALGQAGLYLPISKLIVQCYRRRLDPDRLHRQIVRQLDLFEAKLGRAPDFIDGHQHVHQLPQIREVLLQELATRYRKQRPWLRYTGAGMLAGVSMKLRIKAGIIAFLGAQRFARLAKRKGFTLNRAFLGVYDFQGGQPVYRHLLQNWLHNANDGDLIMCHPASAALESDGMGAQRYAEFEVLASDEVAGWLAV